MQHKRDTGSSVDRKTEAISSGLSSAFDSGEFCSVPNRAPEPLTLAPNANLALFSVPYLLCIQLSTPGISIFVLCGERDKITKLQKLQTLLLSLQKGTLSLHLL